MKIKLELSKIIENALNNADIQAEEIVISDATKPEFGDYQFNGIMKLAKILKQNPRQIAMSVVEHIDKTGMVLKVEVAGPGFINIWLNNKWLSAQTTAILNDDRVGVGQVEIAQKIVVDYSGPNMAKQMHVGHLRSSIIGDTLATLLEFLGNEVIRQNHIGDWGTQFGMLIAYLEEQNTDGNTQELKDLEQFYKNAKVRFDESEAFANKARDYVVKIQSGDEHCLTLWQSFIDASLGHCEDVYAKLNVNLTREDVRAESFYNDQLPQVIEILKEKGISSTSNGAECVFLEGDETPIIIQKGDGGYLYATTDLAALNFRDKELKADRICYVVDARQAQHFKQVFTIAKKATMVREEVTLEHIGFGTMMGQGGKPFKTREGGTPKLADLLDEAVVRAKDTIKDRDVHSDETLDVVAKAIGIGAVKYADLSISRESNYIFNWDKMLSFEGNTSLYMQYAYARIQSILRKHDGELIGEIIINDDVEHRLALLLLKFEDTLTKTAIEATPHMITTYLYDVVTVFMKFYELNPILREDIPTDIKMSRLQLATLTATVIEKGLSILGIEVVEKI
ncbi:MAG: Arginyl-tRNA synthetase (EC [uncultured Sulfurovum sp.]|uniref:Arginine--tRNA ligase n=1 Tax=uncultured Sulfurovum sp. TaxID=269237 RepID=A0A6S6T650_9BACT|nr:MAG: Arginyl-tRNA synthetase (EC [uncultured Sulfurovum sp.]